MKWKLLNLFTMVSLLLNVVVATVWVRSYFVQDDIRREETIVLQSMNGVVTYQSLFAAKGHVAWTRHREHRLISLPELRITEVNSSSPAPSPYAYHRVDWSYQPSHPGWSPTKTSLANHLGFGAGGQSLPGSDRGTYHYAWVPCWFLLLLTGLMPAVRLLQWRRHRRRFAQGRCRLCGYDLRATPDRCPECGTIPSAKLPT